MNATNATNVMKERHLTEKVRPGLLVVLVEIIVALLMLAVLLMLLAGGVVALREGGRGPFYVIRVLLVALPWLVVLYLVLRRWYNRLQARHIVRVLCAAPEGSMTCSEMRRKGVLAPVRSVETLIRRKYIRGVSAARGVIRLMGSGE